MEMKVLMFPWVITKSTMDCTSDSELGNLPWYVSEQGLLLEPASVGGQRAELEFPNPGQSWNFLTQVVWLVGLPQFPVLCMEPGAVGSRPSLRKGQSLLIIWGPASLTSQAGPELRPVLPVMWPRWEGVEVRMENPEMGFQTLVPSRKNLLVQTRISNPESPDAELTPHSLPPPLPVQLDKGG